MKNEILIFIGILVVLILAAGAAVYFVYTSGNSRSENPSLSVVDIEVKQYKNEPGVLVKNSFSINLPSGWQETATTLGALVLVLNADEEIADEKAKEIGFMTFFSINNDYLRGLSLKDYVKKLRDSLAAAIPTIEYLHQWEGQINGNSALFLENESTQQEVDFETLLVFIESPDGLVWAISFNTLKDKWPEYRDLFYQTANSFQLN